MESKTKNQPKDLKVFLENLRTQQWGWGKIFSQSTQNLKRNIVIQFCLQKILLLQKKAPNQK